MINVFSISRRQFMAFTLLPTTLVASIGCGTILYPERRGQPAGPLDWKVVALDALGLLLFFVPGVIAFAVDFTNGTIYLPPDDSQAQSRDRRHRQLVKVHVQDEPLTVEKVEQIVSSHADRDIHLRPGNYVTEELATIDDFWATMDKLEDRSRATHS